MRKYIKRVSIAFSIFLNVLLGGRINQTFSARNWQRKRDKKINLVYIINTIFRNNDHCWESWVKWTIINHAIKKYDEEMGFDRKRRHWYE
jgi:hypothetical protein